MRIETYKSAVAAEAQEFADFLMRAYGLKESPCVIWWFEGYNAFRAEENGGKGRPYFQRESDCRDHFRKFVMPVIAILKGYGLIVIKVGRTANRELEIDKERMGVGMTILRKAEDGKVIVRVAEETRKSLRHRCCPDRNGILDEEYYRACLAGPHNAAFGFVTFPPGIKNHDHPLIRAALGRRLLTMKTGTENVFSDVHRAREHDLLSAPARDDLLMIFAPVAREITDMAKGLPA